MPFTMANRLNSLIYDFHDIAFDIVKNIYSFIKRGFLSPLSHFEMGRRGACPLHPLLLRSCILQKNFALSQVTSHLRRALHLALDGSGLFQYLRNSVYCEGSAFSAAFFLGTNLFSLFILAWRKSPRYEFIVLILQCENV